MSDYSGHVEPGGPAISRTVSVRGSEVEIRKLSVGPMDNNAYVLRDAASGKALLIDAANDAQRLLRELEGLDVVAIHTTHGHGDHWQALDEVADATRAPVWLGPADQPMVPRQADRAADHGDAIDVGAFTVQLLHTPGHTQGSVCVLLRADDRPHLFTGDTLFPGGPGNTFGDADAFATIMESLRTHVFALPDETWVYPGHGDDTTLGAERPQLDEWQQRGW
jgi:glyoxylase-like metal-dependent hydrolase (beta-lactamase superfamily II)